MYKAFKLGVIFTMVNIILIGCWDNVEIDERAFITGLGFDKYEENDDNKEGKDNETKDLKRYIMTVTYPNVGVIAQKEEGDPSFTLSTTASSPSDAKQEINIRNNKNFYLNHCKVIILGQEFAKTKELMKEILDMVERSVYINRKVHLFITDGKAEKIITTDSGRNMDTALYIEELMEKENQSPRIPETSFDYIIINLNESGAALVPKIIYDEGKIRAGGAAVVKDYELVGWLDDKDTRAVNLLRGGIRKADYTTKVEDIYVVVEQMSAKSKLKVYEDKERDIVVDYDIRLEGVIIQNYSQITKNTFDTNHIAKVNSEIEKKIKEEATQVFEKLQKEYRVDVFKIGEYLRRHEPQVWARVKDNWEEVFQEAKLNIDIDMNVRRLGIKS